MLVRQLQGPYAGQIVEMPYAVAQNCVAAGTACWVGDEHKHQVKGLKLVDPEPKPRAKPKAKAKRKAKRKAAPKRKLWPGKK